MVLVKRQAAASVASRAHATGTPGEVKRDPDHPMQDESDSKPNAHEEGTANGAQQATPVQPNIPVRIVSCSTLMLLLLITVMAGSNSPILGLRGRSHADIEDCFPLTDHEHGDHC